MLRLHRNLYQIKRSIREKNPVSNSEFRREFQNEKVDQEKIEIIEIDSADIEIYKPKEKQIEKSKSWNNEENLESYNKARDFLELQRAIDQATSIQVMKKPEFNLMAYKTDNLPDFYKPEETFRFIGNVVYDNVIKKEAIKRYLYRSLLYYPIHFGIVAGCFNLFRIDTLDSSLIQAFVATYGNEVVNTSVICLFSFVYLFKVFQWRLFQFDSKIPASVFITLDQYVSIKYFEPKISKNFKIEVETKFVTLKNPNSIYLQFVRSGRSDYRGYTFYALTESDSEIGFLDKQRLKNLKKQIESENKEFLSRKNDFKRPVQKINFHQVQHFLEKLSSSSNIRVLEFTPHLIDEVTLNPDVQGFLFKDSPILGSKIRLGTKIHIAMRGSNFL